MANHYVICKHCKNRFDRDKIEAIQVDGRRYVHKTCYEDYINAIGKEEMDKIELEKYIKKLFNIDTITARIKKQINDYKKEYNYTYSGILKTLIWWFDIKKNSIEKANNGIGIVPYIYQDACNYYYTLYLAEMANSLEDIKNFKIESKEIVIDPPSITNRLPRLFDFKEWEE